MLSISTPRVLLRLAVTLWVVMCPGFAFANQLTTQGSLRFEIPPGFVPGTKIGYYLQPALGIELRVQLWGCQTNESQREFLMSDQFPFKVPEGVERTGGMVHARVT